MKKPNKRRPDRTLYVWYYLWYPREGFKKASLRAMPRRPRRRLWWRR